MARWVSWLFVIGRKFPSSNFCDLFSLSYVVEGLGLMRFKTSIKGLVELAVFQNLHWIQGNHWRALKFNLRCVNALCVLRLVVLFCRCWLFSALLLVYVFYLPQVVFLTFVNSQLVDARCSRSASVTSMQSFRIHLNLMCTESMLEPRFACAVFDLTVLVGRRRRMRVHHCSGFRV